MHKASEKQIVPILVVMLAAILPLFFKLPFWVPLWCFTLWGYAFLIEGRHWPRPARIVKLVLTVIGCILVASTLGGITFSGDAFIGLLAVMAGLKPLEVRSHRDRMITVFMIYFIIITGLFIIENLLITLYLFPAVLVTTAVLIHLNHPEKRAADTLKLSAVILVQAVPLMALLFFVFPRLRGTFYTVPGGTTGRSGFSETMRPGSISQMVTDNRAAFRVEFLNDMPPRGHLYWRGLVLWDYDGQQWTRGNDVRPATVGLRVASRYWYDITLEPHSQRYLFGLDVPMTIPPRARMMEDYTIMTRWPIKRTYRYRMKSYGRMEEKASVISGRVRQMGLQLPPSGNHSSRELAAKWKRTSGDSATVIDRAVRYFKDGGFTYTLNPPLLKENRIDEFLFDAKQGYCEHYASAFAFLMRAAGIPSRVVVGYLGGDLNPYGEYLIVKQYHAHAWTEVFVSGRGWLRVDPTSVVAPQRVSSGLAGSLRPEELPSFLSRSGHAGFLGYFKNAGLMWDNINLRWNAWFMGFSRNQQRGLWSSLLTHLRNFKTGIFVVVVLLPAFGGVVLFIRRWQRKKGTVQPLEKAYNQFCRKLARVGVRREPSQGPSDFKKMAFCLRGDLKEDIDAIIDSYINLKYGRDKGKPDEKDFLRRVRKFNPERRVKERSAP